MILLFTIPSFLAFVAYVELTDIRIAFKAWKTHIAKTWGRADWVYPVTRETQSWMRTNTIQSYKP